MFRPGVYPPVLPHFLKVTLFLLIALLCRIKWLSDSRSLPLKGSDWGLYLDIHVISAIRLRRFPNLKKPAGFNDQIRWLMLFGQHPLMPQCVDKLRVREFVADRIGPDSLIPLVKSSADWSDIAPILASQSGVLKCAHDSGSAFLFDKESPEMSERLQKRYESLIAREYGVGKGEWPYKNATRAFLVEERLVGPKPGTPPADIKVHCVDGYPKLVHVIADRQTKAKQAFFNAHGERILLRVKPSREQLLDLDFEEIRSKVLPMATALAESFAYVRTDFYLVSGSVYFGELTFFEESGLFQNEEEQVDLAEQLDIKCTNPKPTIHNSPEAA